MRRTIAPVFALLALVAALLVVAGCGGATKTSASGTPAGAAMVPASAPVYISIDTDLSSDQFKLADELLQKFPGREKLLTELRKSLAHEGVDLENVKSAVGPEVDVVVLNIAKSPTVVGLTQPKDEQAFDKLLETGTSPAAHEKVGDWTVFSDEQASIDAFKAAQSGDKLSDSSSFGDAMAKLPGDALVKAYVDGTGLNQALREQLQGQVAGSLGGVEKLKWLAASLEAQSDGAALRFVASGIDQGGGDYTSDLVKQAPQGALLFATFKGTDKTFNQLSQGAGGAVIEQFLGLKLTDVANLFQGETAVWISAGTPIPEVTVVLGGDPKQSIATLDKLSAKLSLLAGGATPKQTTVSGVTLTEVPLGTVSIFYGEVDGKVLVTDTTNSVRDFQSGGGDSLADDAAFKSAVDASGMPDSYGAFVYVNLPDTIAALSGLASTAGSNLPPDVEANVRPLRSAVVWSSQDGGVADVQAFVEIR
jgi:hypothetical protein